MTLAELQKAAATLSPEEQDQMIAALVHLRQQRYTFLKDCLERRAADRGSGKWITTDAFEARDGKDEAAQS